MDIKKIIEETKQINKELNYFNTISDELAIESSKNSKGKLKDYIISVKDCICVKGIESTAGSAILKGYKPMFDATVVDRVKKEGGIIIGKTAQDEFGFGSFSINVGVGFKVPLNPFDKERVCGGSSGGAAGFAQKCSFKHIALGQSTGGSIACPASFCGVVGLCPTYGRVSRYGLMDYANSLDKIGAISKNVYDAALLLEIISGFDSNESTTVDTNVPKYTEFIGKNVKGMKIGVIKEAFGEGTDKDVAEKVKDAIKKLESLGVKSEEISLPLSMKYGVQTYYLIAMAEASTNLAKYCGMRYGAHENLEGNFNEYFTSVRSQYFGQEAKRRIMLGTFARMAGYRDAYYLKALKVRTKIIEEYKNLFKRFDALVSPTMPFIAPKIKDANKLSPLQNYMADILLSAPNLAGLPHISVPAGFIEDMPVGIMFIGNHFMEQNIIQLASAIESKQR
jgi:aspartyl-tRNA(Asn)/glutamyl-tRNA(Gln) amidotransferase subunit A